MYIASRQLVEWHKNVFSASVPIILLSGNLLVFSSGDALAQCVPAQPAPVSIGAGSCTDIGGIREATGDPAVEVTGGTYNAEGVAIHSGAAGTDAVSVSDTGVVNLTGGTTVTTTESHGFGIQLVDSGVLNAESVTITSDGHGGDAILTEGDQVRVFLDDVTIVTNGGSARGMRVREGTIVEGENVFIRTTNNIGPDAGSHGVWTETGSSVTLTDSTILAEATGSSAVESWNGTFIGERVTLRASGPGDYSSGVYVEGPSGLVSLTDSIVSSTASDAHAVYARNQATVSLVDTKVSSSGDNAHGLHLENGGRIEITNTDVTVTGDGAAALSLAHTAAGPNGSIVVNGGRLSSTSGPLVSVTGGHGEIAINSPVSLTPGLVGGRSVLTNVTDNGGFSADVDLSLTDALDVAGDIEVTGAGNILDATFTRSNWTGDFFGIGNTANLALDASRWTGTAFNATNIDVDAASEWNMTGSSIAQLTTNAGRLMFQHTPGSFMSLTTNDYVGSGGIIGLNTVLGDDTSDSDMLIIDGGTASGTSGIVVTNIGGGGEQTTGDGIRVISAVNGGQTDPGAFQLADRAAAGAYEYLLFRSGANDEHDWFLRSHLIEPTGEIPTYRPEAPLYTPVPDTARNLGLASLGTLHERVGEQMNVRAHPDHEDYFNGVWARLIGESGSSSWSGVLDVHANDTKLFGIQGGFDIYRAENEDGHRDHAGIYASYIGQRSRVEGFALGVNNLAAGELTVSGPALGAYWTHYWPEGTYLDTVVQANWFDVSARSDYNAKLNTWGHGFTASLEAGHPIDMGDGWQIEPQSQIIYQTVSVNSASDAFSSVAWHADDAVTGRLGARLQYTLVDHGKLWQPYAKVNLWHGFGGTDAIAMGGSPTLHSGFGQTSLEIGAGLTARLSETTSLYGHMDYRWSLGGAHHHSGLQGAVGLRVNW